MASTSEPSRSISPYPPAMVHRAAMIQRWDTVSFLHWRVPAAALRGLVPDELAIEEFDGSAWIGLVPFRMTMRFPYQPPYPLVSRYAETNVRTYVHDALGRSGLWFFSLDVSSAITAATGRGIGLPYAWSRMSLAARPGEIEYRAQRIAPSGGLRSSVAVVADPSTEDDSELARFLTARFRLFWRGPVGCVEVDVEHDPWVVSPATAVVVREDLGGLVAPGLGPPEHVLFSPGVDVRLGFPRRL